MGETLFSKNSFPKPPSYNLLDQTDDPMIHMYCDGLYSWATGRGLFEPVDKDFFSFVLRIPPGRTETDFFEGLAKPQKPTYYLSKAWMATTLYKRGIVDPLLYESLNRKMKEWGFLLEEGLLLPHCIFSSQ